MINKSKKTQPNWPLITLAIVFLAFATMYGIFILLGYILVPMNRLGPAILSTIITAAMVFLTAFGIKRARGLSQKSNKLAVLLPLCAVAFVFAKAIGYEVDGIELYLLPVYGIIALLCSLAVFFALAETKTLKRNLGVLFLIIIIPMIIWLLAWDFSPKDYAAQPENDIELLVGTLKSVYFIAE